MSDIVYVLTNPAMPGLVKIGYTTQEDVRMRIAQLYSTGVPVPFEVVFAVVVDDALRVETALHTAFAPNRVNPKREFFKIEPEQAIAILRLFDKGDVTQEVENQKGEVDEESLAAGKQLRQRRPNMNFQEMGIAEGEFLHFTQGDEKVKVAGPRKVRLGDEEMSLTAATRQIMQVDWAIPTALYWTFDGRLLRDIYNETYETIE